MTKNITNEIKQIRTHLKQKLLLENTLLGFEKERNQLLDLIQKTIQFGESNSALLIGPRGCGKTALINNVLNELDNANTFIQDALLVKLHGLIHTDDRLALKSATAQLKLDNVVDGKVFGSFAENLSFLLNCLRTGQKQTSKSVVFIIDEFDLFCSHHNQTLLYNLFDISQSAQSPVCIIGITCRLDVIELLEKRVKSRFSHRQIFLFPGPETVTEKTSHLKHALNHIEHYLKIPNKTNVRISEKAKKQWNCDLEKMIQDRKFKKIIQRLVHIDNTEVALKNVLMSVVFDLSENSLLTIEKFQEQLNDFETDDMVNILLDLSVLELCLVITMKHHEEIYDDKPMNFEMIYSRYLKFANAHSNIQSVQRPVIMKAFEYIQDMQIVSMIQTTGSKVQKEYQFCKLLVTPQQIEEAVKKYSQLPSEVVQWASSSLV